MTKELEAIEQVAKNVGEMKKRHKEEIDALKTQMEEMQEDVQRSKEGGPGRMKKAFVDQAEVKDFIAKTFDENGKTSHKATIKLNSDLVFKAAETMTSENFFTGSDTTQPEVFTGYSLDPRLYQRQRKRNTILDHIPIETTNTPYLIYMNKVEVSGDNGSSEDTGGAAWIVSDGEKPGRSFRVSSVKVEAKKVAIYSNVADKLLRDVGSLNNWLRDDLTSEVKEAYNDGLLNNGVDTDAPLGIKENAVTFTVTPAFTNTVASPNLIDALVAAAASMIASKEQPWKFLISSDNYFSLFILKDSNQRYQNANLVYVSALGTVYVAGVPVFPVDDDDVDSDHFLLLGADLGFKIKNYGPLVFERGLNADDFRKDKTSFRAFQEVLSYIPADRYNSVMYDEIETVLNAIGTGS